MTAALSALMARVDSDHGVALAITLAWVVLLVGVDLRHPSTRARWVAALGRRE